MTGVFRAALRLPLVQRAARLAPIWLLLLFGAIILIPNWLILPPDDEGLFKEISATVFQSNQLFSGQYPFWNPLIAFGLPQPLSQALFFHPFLVFVQIFPVAEAIGAFYQLQIWIGILSMWGVVRHLRLNRVPAGLCVVTYALSSATLNYVIRLWPVNLVVWTLAPLLLLCLLKLMDATSRHQRATYSLAAGLCAALMVLDGHLGVFPDYGIAFIAFLIGCHRPVRRVLPWLGLSLLVFALASTSHLYDIGREAVRARGLRGGDTMPLDVWRLFLYPIHASLQNKQYLLVAFGGVFVVLAAIGLVYPRRASPYTNGLRLAVVATFVLGFLPVGWIPLRSANYFAWNPFTIFGVVLAGLTLQALWRNKRPGWRRVLAGAAVLQLVAVVAGFYPYYRDNLERARAFLRAKQAVSSVRGLLNEQPIYRFLEQQPEIANTRTYIAPSAEGPLYRGLVNYDFAAWSFHGLRLVNGVFKNVDYSELRPQSRALKTEIVGNPDLALSAQALNALNIGYVLTKPGDRVAESLRKVATFELAHPRGVTIIAYRNPGAWADAVVLAPGAKQLGSLPLRGGCRERGLLCADFSIVARLRDRNAVLRQGWDGADLHLRLRPIARPRVLLVSQIYRPGWEAQLSDGQTAKGYKLLGGFTAFDLPAGVDSATVLFRPIAAIALTVLSWVTVLGTLLTITVLAITARRRRVARKELPRPHRAGDVGG